ncbi:peptide ABC transporter permease [Laceyella sacchari]|uniref:Peptide/nickel transport system permease protein n=1 Tax=Laceyella tengchongensis TaxID=574699 RepID=A0AA46ACR0_9BACL|nr:ABC transporter permease [Laceyella tengchongensis]AUS07889.1 peptide ABC transporter permease [Laceyella sacchari]SMP00538.1 peptide/nickel transport system permease protein [Laceyella tengchongensis]
MQTDNVQPPVTNLPEAGAVSHSAQPDNPAQDFVRAFFRHRSAVIGSVLVLIFIILAILAPVITPYDYTEPSADALAAPSAEHWFGTDDLGRDIFTRIVYGSRISLWVGFISIAGSIVVGSLLGLLAGYYGKWQDTLISRLFDIMLAFPSILLAIAIVAMLGPGLNNALIAIAIINIPTFGRLMRSRVLSVKAEDFVLAARAIGMKNSRILWHHILPNCWTPIMVQGTLSFATAVIEVAALGFLGLGAQPPDPEWGTMLSDARDYLQLAPWTMVFPGVAIMITVLGFNLLGDGLRDIFDPRMKQ